MPVGVKDVSVSPVSVGKTSAVNVVAFISLGAGGIVAKTNGFGVEVRNTGVGVTVTISDPTVSVKSSVNASLVAVAVSIPGVEVDVSVRVEGPREEGLAVSRTEVVVMDRGRGTTVTVCGPAVEESACRGALWWKRLWLLRWC
jgi:predicted RNA-binding protein with TRAM domain